MQWQFRDRTGHFLKLTDQFLFLVFFLLLKVDVDGAVVFIILVVNSWQEVVAVIAV